MMHHHQQCKHGRRSSSFACVDRLVAIRPLNSLCFDPNQADSALTPPESTIRASLGLQGRSESPGQRTQAPNPSRLANKRCSLTSLLHMHTRSKQAGNRASRPSQARQPGVKQRGRTPRRRRSWSPRRERPRPPWGACTTCPCRTYWARCWCWPLWWRPSPTCSSGAYLYYEQCHMCVRADLGRRPDGWGVWLVG